MIIEYCIEKEWKGDYSDGVRVTTLSYDALLACIENIANPQFCTFNTVVARRAYWPFRWFRGWRDGVNHHIMVLDCDGTDAMLGAVGLLKHDQINYALIQSSPHHYWIVTDYIDTFDAIMTKLQTLPGVDPQFIDYSRKAGQFSLRAIALPHRVPIFSGPGTLTNPHALDFFKQFSAHFEHPVVIRRLRAEIMALGIKEKTLVDTLANPGFEL